MEKEPKFEITESLVDKIDRLKRWAYRKGGAVYYDAAAEFIEKLREKYPNWQKWIAYHRLAYSSPPDVAKEELIHEDFPGEDSIVAFLESFLKEK